MRKILSYRNLTNLFEITIQSFKEHKNVQTTKAGNTFFASSYAVIVNNHGLNHFLFFLYCVVAISLFSGCATLNRMSIGADAPIFIKISESELQQTEFFIDGKPIQWRMIEFNRTLVSSSPNSDTYSISTMPAINVRPKHQYYTLTIKNPRLNTKDILLKRGKAIETKYWLYADMWLSAGIGLLIDVSDNSLLRLSPVDVNDIESESSPYMFYNNSEITLDKK